MTPDLFVPRICKEFSLQVVHVSALARLLAEGATVPFIARYRKEVTGGMDEVVIASVRDRLAQLKEMEERREFVKESIKERGLMTWERERGQSTHSNKTGLHGGTGWVDLVERWLGRYG